MSKILKMFTDRLVLNKPTWWVILECGHWYHWTGAKPPGMDADFPCPECKPLPTVVKAQP